MSDWSQLPYDLVLTITNLLNSIEDFLAFSSVCRSWRTVHSNKHWTPLEPTIPLLMLSQNRTTTPFFSLYKHTIHHFEFPEASARRCWGSTHGWVIITDPDYQIHLLNPITRARINLPPQPTFHNRFSVSTDWFGFIRKAFVFKMCGELLIIAIYSLCNCLAITRPGECGWTTVQNPCRFIFGDVVWFRDGVLAVSTVGTLVGVENLEINGVDPPRVVYIASPPKGERGWQQMNLVESLGDLLMVIRYKLDRRYWCKRWYELVGFKVYKFDFNSREWMKLEDLGYRSLFVDDNYCVSVSARNNVYCKRNCIYFTKDNLEQWWNHGEICRRGRMCVYNMEDGSIESFYLGEGFPCCYSSPIWVVPTLY